MAAKKQGWIDDKTWADIQRRAEKGRTRSPFDPAVVKRRKADEQQARKSRWS